MVNDSRVSEIPGGELLLDGYQTVHDPISFRNKGKEYSLQYYQKKHKNEYTIKNNEGNCYLYKNGLLKMIYKEENGKRKGDFVSLEKGRISFIQDTENLLNTNRWIRKVNDKRGELSEIWEGGRMVYRGKLNVKSKREGIGLAYDKESDVEYEGIFKNDVCIQILKIFEGDEMTELLNDKINVDVANQIPIYVGGWKIDDNGEYIRNGTGYLIDMKTRVATAEVIYENGKKIKEIGLFDGWYCNSSSSPFQIDDYPKPISMPVMDVLISNSTELITSNCLVINLVISSNCCNDISSLNFSQFEQLQSLEIGDECFENVGTFRIDGLHCLQSIKIGLNSFTEYKNNFDCNPSRSFHILNCARLESIEIGRYSFSDYAGEFELKSLPSLSSIKIGSLIDLSKELGKIGSSEEFESLLIKYGSLNFSSSLSFIVEDLSNLVSIELGVAAFGGSLSTVISNLPNLKTIQLGWCALSGREEFESCLLVMKDLPKLETLVSDLGSFMYSFSVTLSNIPNLKRVDLPGSFIRVQSKSISNVSPLLEAFVNHRQSAQQPDQNDCTTF